MRASFGLCLLLVSAFPAPADVPPPDLPPGEPCVLAKPVSSWVAALRDDDPKARADAALALARAGNDAVPFLVHALSDDDLFVRWNAGESLAKIGAVSALVASLKSKDAGARAAAAWSFHFAPKSPQIVPALIEALRDPDAKVRAAAATSLGDFGPDAEAAVPALTQALKDKGIDVSWMAKLSLGEIGHPVDEDRGLATSLRVNGWGSDGELKVTLGYRWTQKRATWVLGDEFCCQVHYWDERGFEVRPAGGADDIAFTDDFKEGREGNAEFDLSITIPKGVKSVSIPYGRSGLETRRVVVPDK